MSDLVPLTRTLPVVLRDALQSDDIRLVVGKVISIPDNAHIRVEIGGAQVTIPRLASYQAPLANDAVYCLATGSVMIAVGIATPTPRGGAAVDPGTATGQVPVWNAAVGRFESKAAAPNATQAANADALDGIDSTGFLRRVGGVGAWQGYPLAGTTDAFGRLGFFHALGVKPTVCLITPKQTAREPIWLESETDVSWVQTAWYSGGLVVANGAVQGSALVGA